MAFDINDPDTKTALDAAIAAALPTAIDIATKELRTKNEQLIGEKRAIQEKMKPFEGLNIDVLKNLQTKIDTDEEMKLLSEGKTDEVFNRRFQKVRNDFDSKVADLTKEAEVSKTRELAATSLAEKTIVEINLRRAAEQAGVLPQAIDDVIRRGDGLFKVENDGTVIQKDKDGNIVTIDGKNAIPGIWLEKLKETSPHYWPGSVGTQQTGGSGGNRTNMEEALLKAAASKDMDEYRRIRDTRAKETKRGT